ncbi:magnesium protoporphyrin IX methyltransferase [Plastoroseomonas arctica]|uniref:Magnesium protoporphyrin IX methyltransferase n=1 Tax=Plastoroseomonas arctica TaxID=1509237 RepID=A0AAF1KNF3_9PROT|nr:magnesium protoporphyrin IX methyltransferase [Plastoroseomonas arctica]MBR0654478.1 magnesium protoporphyrin IX methyltransferase [Plastoroseomonas arctica]
MPSATYASRRGEIKTYFDRTAAEAWKRLTSDVPVSGIRATVRAGREEMRNTILSWLPADLTGRRLLDAGCGTGVLAMEAARRGAHVVATDLSPTLVQNARERAEAMGLDIEFHVGDMTDPNLGRFDHIVAMDSLIHYRAGDAVSALARLVERARASVIFTYAPRTPLLSVMHAMGRLFPRGDRAPSIEPVRTSTIHRLIEREPGLTLWRPARGQRIASGFYTSQAQEVLPR